MATPGPHLGHTKSPGGATMGFFSSEADKEKSPWPNHRNAQPERRGEKVSGWAANTGSERRRRRDEGVTEYADTVGSMKSAPGGSTPKPAKKLSWSERRAADKILREGKK